MVGDLLPFSAILTVSSSCCCRIHSTPFSKGRDISPMAEFSNVQVLYQLSWDGKLEHPHMITVQYPASQDGLRLRDVKKRLTTLRGQGIGHSFSWSYKRNYRSTFIWNDLSDDDVIHPLKGSGEYLLKGSELIDAFASKNSGSFAADKPIEPERIERKERFDDSRHSRTISVDGGHVKEAIDHQLSVEQETIDVEKSDEFCLSSSSDNEVSPRIPSNLVAVMTKSPTVQGLQTSPYSEQVPFSPGSAKRLWRREIKKSLFRTRNNASSSPSKIEDAALQGDEDASLWKESRSKSVNTLDLKEKETVEQSTSQLIRLLWARWTGGSSRSNKRVPSTSNKEERFSVTVEEISAVQEELSSPVPRASEEVEKENFVAVETGLKNAADGPLELKKNRPTLIVPELQVVFESCETPGGGPPEAEIETPGGGPPEAETETPKPAIASADFKPSHGLPKVRTTVTSPKPLPPGFHKGTNDTKPVVQTTPRRSSFRNSIPLASPPLRRSFSRDAARSLAIAGSPEQSDSVASTPSPQKPVKKCINFHERDERPLTPGLTALDWEKALQAAVADCSPPPNFRQILQECSTCGRTFKPDSLEVHRRGCHPPQYARAFSARASPHMIRSRAL